MGIMSLAWYHKDTMNKYKATDVIDEIINTIELARVTPSQMVADIQRMGFKIKPVSGDIEVFDKIRRHFLKPLWKMGRVDEIVQKYLYELSDEEQEILFDFLEEFENKTQVDLNRKLINKTKSRFSAENPLKIEVFKDETSSSKLIN